MQDNVFRFVNVRLPQRKEPLTGTIDCIDPYGGGRYDTDFRNRLVQVLESNGREGARTEVDSYIKQNGIISRLSNAFAVFDQAVAALGPGTGIDTLSTVIRRVFDGDPTDVIARDNFITDRQSLADGITAAFFASCLPIPGLSHLVRGLRLCELIERIAHTDVDLSVEGGIFRVLRATVVISLDDGFVQPEMDKSLMAPRPLYRLSGGLAGGRLYTTSSIERDKATRESGYSYDGIACYVYSQPVLGTIPLYRLRSPSDHLYTTSSIERDNAIN